MPTSSATPAPRPASTPAPAALVAASAAAVAILAAAPASATWSIVAADTRTGEVAAASATCLTDIDLLQETPVVLVGVGAATAQARVDTTAGNRGAIRTLLLDGVDPQAVPALIPDGLLQERQYGIVDVLGRPATFTGNQTSEWSDGVIGRVERGRPGPDDDIVYAIQGNILTGEAVVLAAEAAFISTRGDLADRVMAAMEAARAFGGDGRCSCAAGPEACGAPPEEFTKSADVGYLVVARRGDVDGSPYLRGFTSRPSWVQATDLDADTLPDLTVLEPNTGAVRVYRNLTRQGGPLRFAEPGPATTAATQPTRLVSTDVDGDGDQDIVSFGVRSARTLVNEAGALTAGPISTLLTTTAVVASAEAVTLAPGEPAAYVLTISPNIVALARRAADDTYAVASSTTLPGNASGAVYDPASGAVYATSDSTRTLYRVPLSAAGTFGAVETLLALPTDPGQIDRGDLNGDGLADFAVECGTSRQIAIITQTAPGVFARADLTSGDRVNRVDLADLTGDGVDDLIAAVQSQQPVAAWANDGLGAFTFRGRFEAGDNVAFLSVADLNADGLADFVAPTLPAALVAQANLGDARFVAIEGFAGGDYFLTLNVANTARSDPDPVFTLREMFDAWRAARANEPDAERSTALPEQTTLPLRNEGTTGAIDIHLRTYAGLPAGVASTEGPAITAESTTGVVEVLAVEQPQSDVVRIIVGTTGQLGEDELVVRVAGAVRPVQITPGPRVKVVPAQADTDGDGDVTVFDLFDFLAALDAQAPEADLNNDNAWDVADLAAYLGLL